jgi:hypothetical protein
VETSTFRSDLSRSRQHAKLLVQRRRVAEETNGSNSLLKCPEVTYVGSLVVRDFAFDTRPKDKIFERNRAPGTRIVADNNSKAETRNIDAAITKITMISKITISPPIPFMCLGRLGWPNISLLKVGVQPSLANTVPLSEGMQVVTINEGLEMS